MYSPETGLPDHFASSNNARVEFKPGTEEIETNNLPNVKWIAKVGSQSYGNVVVSGGKVFIGTNNENPRDPQHQGDRSILMCFDEKTGEPFSGSWWFPNSPPARSTTGKTWASSPRPAWRATGFIWSPAAVKSSA
jgi:hypothetical protein